MTVRTPNFSTPAYRYLLPNEQPVVTFRCHPGALAGPFVVVAAGLVGAAVLSNISKFSSEALLIVWLIWGLLLLYLVGKITGWAVNYFVITSHRLMVLTGVLTRDVASMPLTFAAGLKLRRTMPGRLIGYGHLIFEARGQDQALRRVNFVPYPEQLFLELSGMIYGTDTGEEPEPTPELP
jgi:hypothetical protein